PDHYVAHQVEVLRVDVALGNRAEALEEHGLGRFGAGRGAHAARPAAVAGEPPAVAGVVPRIAALRVCADPIAVLAVVFERPKPFLEGGRRAFMCLACHVLSVLLADAAAGASCLVSLVKLIRGPR